MHTEHAERRRDRRLRLRLLQMMHAARIRPDQGWVTGRFVVDVVDGALPAGHGFADDAHAQGLLRDLVAGGHVEARDDRTKAYQPANLDFTCYRITYQGIALVEQQIGPDPLVDDDRVVERHRAAQRGGTSEN
jgi:hypothetical protein